MSPSPQLSPPGSSSYSSNTLSVGDGTWDTEKNTFLLPNLVGLNFATMRYNGMGNRFFTMTGYHGLIKAHGVLAAITFLGLVPAAIMLARFYGRSPFWALRLHIWFQILTLILTTVLFILGFFAVGPGRSLSNPHHGIGVAIYVLILLQVFGGWMVHRKDKGKRRLHTPLKLMLHQWFGRTIALLGMVQIPLGLTLYGSPRYLFILYTLAASVLLLTYFILSWLHQRRLNRDYDGEGSYLSGHDDVIDERRDDKRSGLGKLAVAGLGAAGLAALWRRRSTKSRRDDEDELGTESRSSYFPDEKYSDTSRNGWKSKLLTIGAVAGGIAAVKALFGRKPDDSSDLGPYRPPHGGDQSVISESFIEQGRPPRPVTPTGASPGYVRPSHPLAQPPMTPHHRHSNSSLTSSYASASPSRRDRRHNVRDAVATGGALFALRQMFKSRRQRKEDRRLEEERINRANSHGGYTGDGFSPRRHRAQRVTSQSSTDFSASVINDRRNRPGGHGTGPILGGVGAASAAALADRSRVRPVGIDPPVVAAPNTLTTDMPPLPPTHRTDVDSSGSEVYTTTSGHPHHRHHLRDGAGAATLGAGAAAASGFSSSRRRHSGRTQNTDSMESPPVSLKVKMHNDGRHVTLRRLTDEEAAAQREERRRAKRASVPASAGTAAAGGGIANSSRPRRRNSSFSSSSGGEGPSGSRPISNADRRWRRAEALERQQAEAMGTQPQQPPQPPQPLQSYPPPPPPPGPAYPPAYPPALQPPALQPPAQNQNQYQQYQQQEQPATYPAPPINPATGRPFPFPPPPIPAVASGLATTVSLTSPGTETSGATEYANNRRRRRAERAQARLAREGRGGGGGAGGGQSVEFS